MDQASLLTALTVFLLSADPDVCAVEPLHSLCLQRFTSSMEAKEPLVSDTATPDAPFKSASLKNQPFTPRAGPGSCHGNAASDECDILQSRSRRYSEVMVHKLNR